MRQKPDVNEAITEHTRSLREAADLGRVARLLDEEIGTAVPARPAFRAQLRAQLMAEARRTLGNRGAQRSGRRPWLRYTGWGLGAAAAAAMAVALHWNLTRPALPGVHGPGDGAAAQHPAPAAVNVEYIWDRPVVVQTNHALPEPVLSAADGGLYAPPEVARSGQRAPARFALALPAGAQPPTQAMVYRITPAGAGAMAGLARALGLPEPQADGGALRSADSCQTLALAAPAAVTYANSCPAAGAGEQRLTPEAAEAAARHFLARAGLEPNPATPLTVSYDEAAQQVRVAWEEPLGGGWPLRLAQPNRITLTHAGEVIAARFVPVRAAAESAVSLRPPAEALQDLQGMELPGAGPYRIAISRADLVYGLPEAAMADGAAALAQPFWRFDGTTETGYRFVGYAPAVAGTSWLDTP